jgi:hypothetical protein
LSRAAGLGSSVSPLSWGPNSSPPPSPRDYQHPATPTRGLSYTNIIKLFEFTKFYISFSLFLWYYLSKVFAKNSTFFVAKWYFFNVKKTARVCKNRAKLEIFKNQIFDFLDPKRKN